MLPREVCRDFAPGGRRVAQLLDRQSGQHRTWMRLEYVVCAREFIALLDQKPIVLVLGIGCLACSGPDQRVGAVQLESVQHYIELARADSVGGIPLKILRAPLAAIPYNDRASAIVTLGNHTLEVGVFQRMIF